MKKEENRAEEW